MNEKTVHVTVSIVVGGVAGYLIFKGVSNALKKSSLSDLIALSIGVTIAGQVIDAVGQMLNQQS